MADGLDIDLEQVRAGAARYQELSADFTIVADFADGTDGDESLLGLVGEPFASKYHGSADKVREMIRRLGEAGSGLGSLISDCADGIEEADDLNAESLNQLVEEITP